MNKLGLVVVGMIYTDLIDSGKGDSSVLCKRHAESYFLSSAEIINSATMQLKYSYSTKYASSGFFSSRFLTCVLTGSLKGEIDISTFQISHTGESMVRDGILEACIDPSLLRVVQAEQGKTFIPEVFYKFKNEYGVEVREPAKPTFPVDYLIVDV